MHESTYRIAVGFIAMQNCVMPQHSRIHALRQVLAFCVLNHSGKIRFQTCFLPYIGPCEDEDDGASFQVEHGRKDGTCVTSMTEALSGIPLQIADVFQDALSSRLIMLWDEYFALSQSLTSKLDSPVVNFKFILKKVRKAQPGTSAHEPLPQDCKMTRKPNYSGYSD